jgi:DNA-binding transcriptional regulator LsrR (DeoR family)
VRDLILSSDVACFAASEMSEESLLIRLGLPLGISVQELRAAGAVGDVLGTFLDIEGKPVDHPINDQLVGPGPDELRSMKTLVLASGGSRKTDIITGALRSGLIHVLVCDEATARKVLSCGPLRKR